MVFRRGGLPALLPPYVSVPVYRGRKAAIGPGWVHEIKHDRYRLQVIFGMAGCGCSRELALTGPTATLGLSMTRRGSGQAGDHGRGMLLCWREWRYRL